MAEFKLIIIKLILFLILNKSLYASTTITFDYTGDIQTWVVPDGVSSITVEAYGASGGEGCFEGTTYTGGLGAYVISTFDVSAGEDVYVVVGGEGSSESSDEIVYGGYNGK